MWGWCKRCAGFSFSLNEVHVCIGCEMERVEAVRLSSSLCRRKHEHGCSKERCHRDTDIWDSREAWKRDDSDVFTTIATVAVANSLLSERPQAESMDMKVENAFQGGESGGGGASASFDDSSDSSSSSSYDSGSSSDSGGSCSCD